MFLVPEYLSQGLEKQHKQPKLYRAILFLLDKGRQDRNMATSSTTSKCQLPCSRHFELYDKELVFIFFMIDSSSSFLGNTKI